MEYFALPRHSRDVLNVGNPVGNNNDEPVGLAVVELSAIPSVPTEDVAVTSFFLNSRFLSTSLSQSISKSVARLGVRNALERVRRQKRAVAAPGKIKPNKYETTDSLKHGIYGCHLC